jgi:hypothetical protein
MLSESHGSLLHPVATASNFSRPLLPIVGPYNVLELVFGTCEGGMSPLLEEFGPAGNAIASTAFIKLVRYAFEDHSSVLGFYRA